MVTMFQESKRLLKQTIQVEKLSNQSENDHECCVVMPSRDYLLEAKIQTDLKCPVLNCDQIFKNLSALNFHMEKSHGIGGQRKETTGLGGLLLTKAMSKHDKELNNCNCKYYCPQPDCKYFRGAGDKYLPTFHSLKNHFIRLHGDKLYRCDKCQVKTFSIKSELNRHQDRCGVLFKCYCGCFYSTKNALLKHKRLKSHLNGGDKGDDLIKVNGFEVNTKALNSFGSSFKIKNAAKLVHIIPLIAQPTTNKFKQPTKNEASSQTNGSASASSSLALTHNNNIGSVDVQTNTNLNDLDAQYYTYNLHSQETQTTTRSIATITTGLVSTSTSMMEMLDEERADGDEYLCNVGTSTSPFRLTDGSSSMNDEEIVWSEISTQTNLTSFQPHTHGYMGFNHGGSASMDQEQSTFGGGNKIDSASITDESYSINHGTIEMESREVQTSTNLLIDTYTQTRLNDDAAPSFNLIRFNFEDCFG